MTSWISVQSYSISAFAQFAQFVLIAIFVIDIISFGLLFADGDIISDVPLQRLRRLLQRNSEVCIHLHWHLIFSLVLNLDLMYETNIKLKNKSTVVSNNPSYLLGQPLR